MEDLFVYGTLMETGVQRQLFGHTITTKIGQLNGFKKTEIRIPNNSQGRLYPIISSSKNSKDKVTGQILKISKEELQIADRYEGPDYKRQRVVLHSGEEVWTYTSREV